MQHILIISFDELLRNESNAFHLMEQAVQSLKSADPTIVVDYFDLLQEQITYDEIIRFQNVSRVFVVFSAYNKEKLPELFMKKMEELKTTALVTPLAAIPITLILNTMYYYYEDIQKILLHVFGRRINFVTHIGDLTEELFSLEEKTQE